MKIFVLEVGAFATNCYLAINERDNRAVIIDPGADARQILAAVEKEQLAVEAVLLTHGHSDHIGALAEVAGKLRSPVFIGEPDAKMLTDANINLSRFMGEDIVCKSADRLLRDGDSVDAAGFAFTVLATPGHTPGGCCFKYETVVFCGDTIFLESIGRTDLPGGSYPQLIKSIRDKILSLPDNVKLLPGHGPSTDVGWERKMNPFLQ